MSLTSWSEASLCRNILALDPFQRRQNQRRLHSVARDVRFHVSLNAAIVRATLGFPVDYSEAV